MYVGIIKYIVNQSKSRNTVMIHLLSTYIFDNFCCVFMQITYWYNRLDIYDETHEQHMKIGEVYGHSGNKLLRSISTSGKSMYIKFRKEFSYGSVKTEFKASIKYKKINFDCQTWLDIDKNILMSPNHPINSNCSWLITSNFGTFIRLDFKFIEVDYYF